MKHKIIALLTLAATTCAPSAFGMSSSTSTEDSKAAASSSAPSSNNSLTTKTSDTMQVTKTAEQPVEYNFACERLSINLQFLTLEFFLKTLHQTLNAELSWEAGLKAIQEWQTHIANTEYLANWHKSAMAASTKKCSSINKAWLEAMAGLEDSYKTIQCVIEKESECASVKQISLAIQNIINAFDGQPYQPFIATFFEYHIQGKLEGNVNTEQYLKELKERYRISLEITVPKVLCRLDAGLWFLCHIIEASDQIIDHLPISAYEKYNPSKQYPIRRRSCCKTICDFFGSFFK